MKILVYISIVLTTLSCKKENNLDCIKSTGTNTTIERSLISFNTLNITDNINVNVIPSSYDKVIIEGGKNIIPLIKTEISDNTLFIKNDNKCNFVRSYKPQISVTVFCSSLNNITMTFATGNVSFLDTIHTTKFNFYAESCAGETKLIVNADSSRYSVQGGTIDLNITGQTEIYNALAHTGLGTFNSNKLLTSKNLVYSDGLGELYTFSNGYLWAHIEGRGNIYYTGNPTLIQKLELGSGKLIEQ